MNLKKISGYHLKYIALFSMFLDHIGVIGKAFLSKNVYFLLRAVGRLSSPCFALYWQKAFSTQKTEKNTSRDYLFLHFYQKYLMTWHSTIYLLQHLIPFYIYKNCHLLTFQPPFKSKMYYSPYF